MKKILAILGPAALLIILSFVLYHGSTDHSRVGAEEELVWGNPAVTGESVGQILLGRWQGGEYRPQVRPLAVLVRATEHSLYDYRRSSYQTTQIILHGLLAVLVCLLLSSMLGSWIAGVLGGVLFVVHPGLSHSVLYLGGLAEILCGLFFFGALLCLLRDRERAGPSTATTGGRNRAGVFGMAILAFLAATSKEVGFLLPICAGAAVLSMPLRNRERLGLILPVLAGAGAALLVRIVAVAATPEPLSRIPAVDPVSGMPVLSVLARALAGIAAEAGVLIFPLRLSHDYSWLFSLSSGVVAGMIIGTLLLVVLGFCLAARRGDRFPRTVLIVVALLPLVAPALVPRANGTLASERNLYLALPGWIGLLLLAGRSVIARRPGLGPILAGAIVGIALLLSVRTMAGVRDFRDDDTLLRAAQKTHPRNPQVLFTLGNERLVKADYTGAKDLYQQALALRPDFPLAEMNLAAATLGLKDNGAALRILDPLAQRCKHVRALRMVDAKAHYHAGLILLQQERNKEAALAFERTLLFYPDHLGARGNLGIIYIKAPQYVDRGIMHLRYVLAHELDPKRRESLGKALAKAEEMIDGYVEEFGETPSKREPPGSGAIGEPWKDAAAEGM